MRMTTVQAMWVFMIACVVLMFLASRFFHFFSVWGLVSTLIIFIGLRYIIRRHVVIVGKKD